MESKEPVGIALGQELVRGLKEYLMKEKNVRRVDVQELDQVINYSDIMSTDFEKQKF